MAEIPKLDAIDYKILDLLNANARASYTELGKELGLSSGSVQQRVKRLYDLDIIKQATLVLNYEALGYNMLSYIGIMISEGHLIAEVEAEIKRIPQITVANYITGKFTIFCRTRTKNALEMKDLLNQIQKINGVQRTETMVSFDEIKNSKAELIKCLAG